MSIVSAIELKQQQVAQAYTVVSDKGGTLPSVKNLENLADAINSISSGSYVSTTATFTENGVYSASSYSSDGFSEVTVDVPETEPSLVSITIAQNGTYLPSEYEADGFSEIEVNVPPEAVIINKTITQNGTYTATDEGASGYGVVNVKVPYIPREISTIGVYQTVSSIAYSLPNGVVDLGDNVLRCALMGSNIQVAIFSGLESISGDNALNTTFSGCSNLISVDLSDLENITGDNALANAFEYCTSLTSLSFPALTTTSFGSNTNQFNNMLLGINGCTVHFPQEIEGTIGNWSDVLAGFGGTNTEVLFDIIPEEEQSGD